LKSEGLQEKHAVATWGLGNHLSIHFYLLKPTGHMTHHQFNIQQLYALPTLYLCVLYLSENKQRLLPHKKLIGFYNREEKYLQCATDWGFKMKQSALRLLKVRHRETKKNLSRWPVREGPSGY
jgi:hypothetical protein